MQEQLVVLAGGMFFGIVEAILLGSWVRGYYRMGLPIFRRRAFAMAGVNALPDISFLQERFRSKLLPPLRFRTLDPGEIAFREQVFHARIVSYTPVMRGLIRFDPSTNEVVITGLLNWSIPVIATVLYVSFVQAQRAAGTDGGIVFLIILAIGLPYLLQVWRFNTVATQVIRDCTKVT